jgi:hypothetical protein
MKTLKCSGAILCLFLSLTPLVNAQQLKLGAAPNQLEKSALLELNSDKQGLLLPRVNNFNLAPLNAAPDGMLIYNVPDRLLYIRKNGVWRKLVDETSAITSVNGQTTSTISLTTNDIPESPSNLYYTDTRARSAFSAGTGITISGAGVVSAQTTTALWNALQLRGRAVSNATPANNDVLTWDNTTSTWLPKAVATSGGTVTSVALSLPSIFSVTGSPVTTSGTLGATFASQTARTVFAAPVAANGTPSFRLLDPLDIPSLDAAKITSGTLPIARGGTGTNTIGSPYQFVIVNAAGNGYTFYTPTATDFPAGSPYYVQNISSGTQTANFAISGNGRIGGTFTLSGLTAGSVPFIGTGGLVSQNNSNFFWDATNSRLGIGTNTPNNTLEVGGTTAATGISGLRLKDLNTATVQPYNSKVLSVDNSGNVIVTANMAGNNWLITGNTNVAAGSFLGTTDDKVMSIRSNNLPFLEFGRRQTLGLVQSYPEYTDNDEKVTYLRSALQFEVPATVSFYKPKMWTTADGNFRMKGPSAGTDFFEFGATGTNNNGGFEFIIGDDGNEPILFKSYNYNGPTFTEMLRLQSGNVGVNMNGAGPARNLTVNGTFRFTGSVGISNKLLGRNDTDGDVATIGVGTTLTMSSNVLEANNTSAIWNAERIQGVPVSSNAPANGQVLTYNGTVWAPATPSTGGTGTGWGVTGNASTNPATNFLGTTDAQPLVVKTNNTEVMRATSAGTVGVKTNAPNSTLNVNGSFSTAVLVSTDPLVTTINADATMYTIYVKRTSGSSDVTINLPAAATCTGRIYVVMRNFSGASGAVVIKPNGAEKIQTKNGIKLWDIPAMMIQSTGVDWLVINGNNSFDSF